MRGESDGAGARSHSEERTLVKRGGDGQRGALSQYDSSTASLVV